MNRFRHRLAAIALCLLCACSPAPEPMVSRSAPPATESFRDFGDYVVHFNAISTTQLTPEVARDYGIVRSGNRAMLNVSIIRKQAGSVGSPVAAAVLAWAVNLTGQRRALDFREIREQTAVYYIAEFSIANEETLTFSIDVTPAEERNAFSVRYVKQFFVN